MNLAKVLKMSNVTQKRVDILFPFLRNYVGLFSASKISNQTKIPQQTVSRVLNDFVSKNLLNFKTNGKNKDFYFDFKKLGSLLMLGIVENFKSLTFIESNQDVSIIINEMLLFCDSIVVFGSYASGKNKKNSDLDLILFGVKNKKKIEEIKLKYNLEINEHYFAKKYFSDKSIIPLRKEVLDNHVIFGNVSEVVKLFLEASL